MVFVCVVVGCLTTVPGRAQADSSEAAAKLCAEGRACLAKADLEGAKKAFKAAAKADRENEEYRQLHAVVRRVIRMRKALAGEKDPEKWATTARALRGFYYGHEIYTEALALDQQTHAKQKTTGSAVMLAETQLELGMNADAASLLGGFDHEAMTTEAWLLLGVAQARRGETAAARNTMKHLPKPDEVGPGMLFDMARLHTLMGNPDEAAVALTKCFESTPPSRLDAFKAYAKEYKDLHGLVTHASFAKVLETKSKVKESKCSGGKSCGKCPSKGGCASKKAGAKQTGKEPCGHGKNRD
jgi:tetratricopeptide (TPR) repeat protein